MKDRTSPCVIREAVSSRYVAGFLGVSERLVRDLAARGRIPALRVDSCVDDVRGAWVFDRAQVESLEDLKRYYARNPLTRRGRVEEVERVRRWQKRVRADRAAAGLDR